MRCSRFGLAVLVLSLSVPACTAAGQRPAAGSTDSQVSIDAALIRKSFSIQNNTLPMWRVELTVTNRGTRPVALGRFMILGATVPSRHAYLAVGVVRKGAGPDQPQPLLAERFGIDWGIDVPAEGIGFWPLGQLANRLTAFDR